jgi:Tfp pilus assembly protein PilF
LIQTTAPISAGSSGGGLFDSKGNLIGITSARIEEGQNLNFAVPIAAVANAVSLTGSERSQLIALAIAYLQAGRDENAQKILEQLLKISPAHSEGWYLRYLAENNIQDRRAKAKTNVFADAWQASKDAQALVKEALRLNPSFSEAWSALASIHEKEANEMRNAGKHYMKDTLCPPILDLWKDRRNNKRNIPSEERHHLEQAKLFMQEAIKACAAVMSDNAEYHILLSYVCQDLGEYDNALTSIKAAIRLEPNNLRVLQCLQSYYRETENEEEELKTIFKIAKGSPKGSREYFIVQQATGRLIIYFRDIRDYIQAEAYTRDCIKFRELWETLEGKEKIQKEKDQAEAQLALEEIERQPQ